MATHSSILAWRIPCRRILEGYSPQGCKELDISWNSSTLATSCEELTPWRRLWCWEGLGAGGEGDDRGWDGWMASLTRWTWVWVNSGIWWWTERPGVLRFMGSQRVGLSNWTELNWTHRLSLVPSFVLGIKNMANKFSVCVSKWQYLSFPGSLTVKNPPCNAGDLGSIPGLGRIPIPWNRKWQPTPVFLPGEFRGQSSLVGCGPWGHKSRTWRSAKPPHHRLLMSMCFF